MNRTQRRALALGAVVGALAWTTERAARWSGLGTVRRGRSAQPGISLLLRGGPDPQVTSALLSHLQAAGVTATFLFEEGAARAHPALVEQAVQGGHTVLPLVGGPGHSPWALARGLRAAQPAFAALTGTPPTLFAPGPGVGGVVAALAGRWGGLTPVAARHRSAWGTQPRGLRPGALLELEGTAPVAVPHLPLLLADLQARGYEIRGLGELRGLRPEALRDLPATALQLVDVLYDRVGGIRRIGGHASSLFRVGAAPYPLADVTVPHPGRPGGLTLRRGEPLTEFHLDSARLVELAERPLAGRRIVTHSIRDLAATVRDDPDCRERPAVFSISIFADVLALYGFTVVDLPPAHRRRLTWWSRTLRRAYGVSDPHKAHVPRLAVMAREELIRRHATHWGHPVAEE
ncbi:polysaccharide deacetylase family protein [Deinococcus arcticus]|uniref:polysaccharide deacetylase family protein n=1 Tax=Deinococcus arcticus TaxID=2136176 RepID=UPI0011B1DDCE|nr:polysaccharide deacetylase family protein [Deinococcus arcticus]